MRLRTITLAMMATGLHALPTSAAEPGPYLEPAPAFAPSWTGLSLGVLAGWATADFAGQDLFVNGVQIGTFANSDRLSGDGFLGGVKAGYDWQSGQFVGGVAADWTWTGISDSAGLTILGASSSFAGDVDWIATARLRGGWLLSPTTMLYVTGGGAFAGADVASTLSFGPASITASDDETLVGYTVGAGIEGQITDRFSANLEYLYADFGEETYDFRFAPGAVISASAESDAHLVRVGFSYRWDR